MSCGPSPCSHATQTASPPTLAAPALPSPFGWLPLLVRWQRRWRLREDLRELDDRTLRDVGLTRAQVTPRDWPARRFQRAL